MIKTKIRMVLVGTVALGIGWAGLTYGQNTAAAPDKCPVDKLGDKSKPKDWNNPNCYDWEAHQAYIAKVESALGTFKDIPVWERSSESEPWTLLNGEYIPVTVDGKTPETYTKNMISDRPMVLPIHVEGFDGGDGQSNPYSVVGRMQGSNPEVQWVFLVRKYYLKDPMDADFVDAGDVAIIGHHPRTGESTYFQFYDPSKPKSARVVVSPFSGKEGMRFWSPLVTQAKVFQCQRCHNTDPFIHTPWIDQVRVRASKDGEPFPEPMVPSNPLGSFAFIDSDDGQMFNFWNDWLRHLDSPENLCTSCHRIAPFDLGGFYQTSTKFVGVDPKDYNEFAKQYHDGQTKAFKDQPWMPPVSDGDFYVGQTVVDRIWKDTYEDSAEEVNSLKPFHSQKLRRVPKPPMQYREIIVDRPNNDTIAPKSSLWIVDTRMRANTVGQLKDWRFFGNDTAPASALAAPVIYERVNTDGRKVQFRIVFVGQPQSYQGPDQWSSIADSDTFDLKQGDYLGMVLLNQGTEPAKGLVPYTEDNWTDLVWSDGTTNYVDGLVTHKRVLDEPAQTGDVLTFEETAYQTYSFEMRNAH